MASEEADSKLSKVVIPALEKIVKNASWRKHSKLAQLCKALIEKFPAPDPQISGSGEAPIVCSGGGEFSLSDAEAILGPLISACSSGFLKIADPALDCFQKLIAHGYLRGEADNPDSKLLFQVIEAICKCRELGDDAAELLVLKTLLSAVTSTSLRIHGDCLLLIVRTCYDIYLESKNSVNQTTAKASLIQMLVIVFRRMEADSSTVPIQPIVVAELMDPGDKTEGVPDPNMVQFVQGFISKIMSDIDVVLNPSPISDISIVHDGAFASTAGETTNPADLLDSTDKDMLDARYWEINMYKTALEGKKGEEGGEGDGDRDDDLEVQISNKLRRDAFLVFRALCKLSMKSPPKEASADPNLMRGKIVALELLKILLENAGAIFRTSDRFLGAIKQYLCLSLLKNSASTLVIVFQLSCSIFMSLVSRFRPGLKAEIGVFFPMIVLRVLENVSQPNFQQKMIVLRFLDKLCVDSQILVDIFINYDCDVNSSNIFERIVNGLLKTAQGIPPGVTSTLLPPQEATMKLEAMKCLVSILRSMGDWLNKQLRIPDSGSPKRSEVVESSAENGNDNGTSDGKAEEPMEVANSHPESANGSPESVSFEQRRAYKLELQEGISLFNQKPKRGIEFLIKSKKVGESPEDIAAFLKDASGLNKTLIGDYLGERDDLPLKVMHAYVDSYDFQGMDFDEAIQALLQGFRLPGEAQKIDRIMEKFAERYCKCNPTAFRSADTAYVLAYSVIMLNTDAHNPMVKNKMSADDFVRNNRGIDDGNDLGEEYLRSLFERIVRNEIKMKENDLAAVHRQTTNTNRILGLDSILNIVVRKRSEDKSETSDEYIRHMQEQFKEKARKSGSAYYAAADVVILKFMIEVCWAPMLAAFSVPVEQSEDEVIISLCLDGFRCAIHVTAVISMKTHRDAFLSSLAKFTSLHSAADIKQKNIDAIKAIVTIADEDGNYLQDGWEHILTCVSRFEHLYLLGEGAPPDATFFGLPQTESDKSKQQQGKSSILPVLRKKGAGKIQYPAAAVRRGSYDSAGVGGFSSGTVTSEQMSNLVSNLNMLEQVGPSEMNRIFTRSQKLNSEAVVDFVKALCKVSMEELRSTSDPRVFSLTKIVEISHYNMNRIRLVWSKIWHVLSEFFVTIGCSENLSIAIFAMDSLRQLSMKFLEREELANYNFQNEFMKPFVIVMRKSRAVEIRELIIRCISQMVLTRVNNVKSAWKSMFMVFSTAAFDEHKNIVLLAFEIVEKIVREYFPYITETETTTFTDFVNCLIAFANSRFNKEISLNAIGFLQVCASKLAHGEVGTGPKTKDVSGKPNEAHYSIDKEDTQYFWFPLLVGLSELSFDLRPDIRKIALQVLFDTLRNHGHHFTPALWERVFDSVLLPIFDYVRHAIEPSGGGQQKDDTWNEPDQDAWLYETSTLALQLVVDLFVNFYDTVGPLLRKVLTLLTSFIRRPHQSLAGIGIAAFVRLITTAGALFSEDKWREVGLFFQEVAAATLPDFSGITAQGPELAIADVRCRAAVQLLLIQAGTEMFNAYKERLSEASTMMLFEAFHGVAVHARRVNRDEELRARLQELGAALTQMQDPPLVRLESEAHLMCLALLQNLVADGRLGEAGVAAEGRLVELCKGLLEAYLETAAPSPRAIPLGAAKRRELAAGAPLVVAALDAVSGLAGASFENNLAVFFPLLAGLIRCEHGSGEIQAALSEMLGSRVGPVLLRSC
ncbi:brefeldin A-inhibited guanine nucleotide-exchange protein 2-like [Wolffia australiana]